MCCWTETFVVGQATNNGKKEIILKANAIGLDFEKLVTNKSLLELKKMNCDFGTNPISKNILNYYTNYRGLTAVRNFYGKDLKIKACLYCNAQFSALLKNKNSSVSKLGFQLDHYLAKDDYPLLALSLYNLIPVCGNCNQRKLNSKLEIFYPYEDDINKITFFDLNEEKLIKYLLGNNSIDFIEWKLKNDTYKEKFKNHQKIFKIEQLYNANFKDIIKELLNKQIIYNDSRVDELSNLSFLNIDENMMERIKLGNYTLDEDINKRPLSKLVKDISERLSIITKIAPSKA